MNRFFHEVIEPSLERIPVLQVRHSECHKGRRYRFAQTVHRNVYTEFDRCLSGYLAATRGEGFPVFTVEVEVDDEQAATQANRLQSSFHDSVPHALMDLAERAFKRAGPIELTYRQSVSNRTGTSSVLYRRKIQEHEIGLLRGALSICEMIGDPHFLDISGDFGTVIATPPGSLSSVTMHLQEGLISVPSSPFGESPPFKWPIYGFNEYASSNTAAGSYLARVAHAVVAAKEEAILAFRLAAEQRIVDFHEVLGGKPLHGHWLESAQGLVARLKAGFGDTLKGVSEHARGICLDLSAALAASGPTHASTAPARLNAPNQSGFRR